MSTFIKLEVGAIVAHSGEIQSFTVKSALGAHTRSTVELYVEAWKRQVSELIADLAKDQPIRMRLTVTEAKQDAVIFEGELESVAIEPYPHGGGVVTFVGATMSKRMHQHRNTAYFRNSTFSDIARKLGGSLASAPAGEKQLNYVQYGESDFDFLVRIADDHGYFVRPSGDGLEVRSGFEDSGIELVWRQYLLALSVRSRLVNHGFKGAHYETAEKHDHRFHGLRKEPGWTGGAAGAVKIVREAAERVAGGGDPHVEVTGSRTPALADYRALLERESERALGRAVVLRGRSTHSGLQAGDAVEIRDGGERFPLPIVGRVGLVAVTHRFRGQMYSNSFTATPWSGYTNPQRPRRGHALGVVPAVVVDNADPQSSGRIRVRYWWQGADERSGWTRLVTPYAGNGRGIVFVPEVGDEVLVAFEAGDPERPYVIGSVWNGKDHPAQDGHKRIITAAGNAIELLEEEGKEVVEIRTAKGTCLLHMSNDADGTPLIVLHSEGNLTLEAQGRIQLSCQELVEFIRAGAYREVGGDDVSDVQGELKLKAGMNVTVEAGVNLGLKGGANVDSVAGAMNNVVGSLVHLQPPGHFAKPLTITPEVEEPSGWEERPVPEAIDIRTTADQPTPRAVR